MFTYLLAEWAISLVIYVLLRKLLHFNPNLMNVEYTSFCNNFFVFVICTCENENLRNPSYAWRNFPKATMSKLYGNRCTSQNKIKHCELVLEGYSRNFYGFLYGWFMSNPHKGCTLYWYVKKPEPH